MITSDPETRRQSRPSWPESKANVFKNLQNQADPHKFIIYIIKKEYESSVPYVQTHPQRDAIREVHRGEEATVEKEGKIQVIRVDSKIQ